MSRECTILRSDGQAKGEGETDATRGRGRGWGQEEGVYELRMVMVVAVTEGDIDCEKTDQRNHVYVIKRITWAKCEVAFLWDGDAS